MYNFVLLEVYFSGDGNDYESLGGKLQKSFDSQTTNIESLLTT